MPDRPIPKRGPWPPRRSVLWGTGGVALLVAGLLSVRLVQANATVDSARVVASQVHHEEFVEEIPILGTVEPAKTVHLDAIEGGAVEEILAEDGARVAKGDLILRLANSDLVKETIGTESRLFENVNALRNTKMMLVEKGLLLRQERLDTAYHILTLEKEASRYRAILAQGGQSVNQADFESVTDELDYQRQRLEVVDQRIAQENELRQQQMAQVDETAERVGQYLATIQGVLDHLEVRAPVSGTLSMRRIEIGQSIDKGANIGQVADLDALKIRGEVDQHYAPRMALGQRGRFEFDGATYELLVDKVYPDVQNDVFDVDFEFVLDQPPMGLKRGQTIQVVVSLSKGRRSMVVDKGPFYRDTNGNWVYVVGPDREAARRVEVRIGRQNLRHFELLDGLGVGDWVITSSYETFNDADRVRFDRPLDLAEQSL